MTTSRLPREDLKAALAARRELGPDYDDAFAEAVAERVEQVLEERLAHYPPAYARATPPPPVPGSGVERGGTLAIAIISLVASIPLTAIAADMVGIEALVVVWLGLTMINVAYAMSRRR